MVNTSSASHVMATVNHTLFDTTLPSLPEYNITQRKDLFSSIPDSWLMIIAPVVIYWLVSMSFHIIDLLDLFPQYRLHTPDEITKRNHVSRYEVARDVIVQQIIQMATGAVLAATEPPELVRNAEYDVAVWATRLRMAQRMIPGMMGLLGLNATAISKNLAAEHPLLAGVMAGGYYPFLTTEMDTPAFAKWEMTAAKAIYHVGIPVIQFFVGFFILDTWQYFLHRFMHMNKWMYTTFHSRHHRLYVPYAYGALYNHPFEGFLLDTLGASLAFKATAMTTIQGTLFFCFSTIKTVDDHCGYAFPWDPLQLVTSNNAEYHDVHHQTWGIKTNFSQPFFTFWDSLLNTRYEGKRKRQATTAKKNAVEQKVE